MQDDNPAAKCRNKTGPRIKGEPFDRSSITAPAIRTRWSDAKIINAGIRLIASLLKLFERFDPERFHRLAVGIAKEIAGDFPQIDESTRGLFRKPQSRVRT